MLCSQFLGKLADDSQSNLCKTEMFTLFQKVNALDLTSTVDIPASDDTLSYADAKKLATEYQVSDLLLNLSSRTALHFPI